MSKIILKKSSVASKVPVAGDLEYGELALNYTDGKLFYKDSSNNIQELTGGASGSGDMTKAIYDTDNDGIVDQAASVPWTGVTGAPTFAAVATSGNYNDLTNIPTTLSGYGITDAVSTSGGTVTGTLTINGSIEAEDNASGVGATLKLIGSTGAGVPGPTTGNGHIEILGPGTTSLWTSFSGSLGRRRRGGVLIQSGTNIGDAGGTYVNGADIQLFAASASNNGTAVGQGGNITLSSGSTTKTDGQNNTGSTITISSATSSSGGAINLQTGSYIDTPGGLTATGSNVSLGSGSNGVGGLVNIYAGGADAINGTNGGNVSIYGGRGYLSLNPASIIISGNTPTVGGDIVLTPGTINASVSGAAPGKVRIGTDEVLHTGNYNTYSPTLAGTGASGTWNIDISGNAATADSVDWSGVTGTPSFATVATSGNYNDLINTPTFKTIDGTSIVGSGDYSVLPTVAAATGDIIGVVDRTAATLSFNDSTRTFTITPVSGSWTFYYQGTLKTVSAAKSVVITNTDGARWIKIDPTTLELVEFFGSPVFESNVNLAYIHWDTTTSKGLIIGDERHGSKRDTTWHSVTHLNVGTVWRSGGALSYTLNNDSSVNFGVGTPLAIQDEDLTHTITHAATPSSDYQQILTGAASVPVMYLTGTGTYTATTASTTPWVAAGLGTQSYSAVFDGNGDYATFPANAAFSFGTGDFTIEFWLRIAGAGDHSQQHIFQTRDGIGNGILVQYDRTNKNISAIADSGLTTITTATNSILDSTWYHVALVRNGSNAFIYINGTQGATGPITSNLTSNTSYISRRYASDGFLHYVNGSISNFRVVKGTAVYTGTFSPSTVPLTSISGTSILTFQNSTFIDNSTNNFTVSVFGNTATAQTSPLYTPTNLASYNYWNGSAWILADASEGYYITYWLIATNDIRTPVKLVLGRTNNATIDAALAEDFTEYGLSFAEQVFMYQIVVKTSSAYTGNSAKVQIAAVRKILAKAGASVAAVSATTHNSLTGRDAGDSHTIASITNLQTTLDSISPLTTKGDIYTRSSTANVRLPVGGDNLYLAADSTTASGLAWKSISVPAVAYTADSLTLTNGVYVMGDVTDTQVFNDGNSYQITDGTGAGPAWIITFTFTNVVSFNRIVANVDYTLASGHTIYFQLYNNYTMAWDNIGSYSGSTGFSQYSLGVLEYAPYISSGAVQARLYHSNAGSATHTTKLDYFALEQSTQGAQGPRGATGATGSTGQGVPVGGTTGQALVKSSAADYATTWADRVISVGGTAPISSSGGTTPSISISQATTTTDGYLSSTDWNTFNNKQTALASGTNIKTINSTSILGSGNIAVQPTLVSGTNIKTINGSSILGSGDLVVSGGGGGGATGPTTGLVLALASGMAMV